MLPIVLIVDIVIVIATEVVIETVKKSLPVRALSEANSSQPSINPPAAPALTSE